MKLLKEKDINNIVKIIKEASIIALEEQKKITVETKPDSTIVTNGDLKVSQYLEEKLSKYYPVLSEENYDLRKIKKDNVCFLIDPIDGTVSYSKKEDTWVMIITLISKNEPMFSFIYHPSEDKMYFAEKDHGAYLIQGETKTQIKTNHKERSIIVSPNYKKEDLKILPLDYKTMDLNFAYGCALKILNIVEEKAYFYPIKDRYFGIWDLAGPYLLLNEAGGDFQFLESFKFNLKHNKINTPFIARGTKEEKRIVLHFTNNKLQVDEVHDYPSPISIYGDPIDKEIKSWGIGSGVKEKEYKIGDIVRYKIHEMDCCAFIDRIKIVKDLNSTRIEYYQSDSMHDQEDMIVNIIEKVGSIDKKTLKKWRKYEK